MAEPLNNYSKEEISTFLGDTLQYFTSHFVLPHCYKKVNSRPFQPYTIDYSYFLFMKASWPLTFWLMNINEVRIVDG